MADGQSFTWLNAKDVRSNRGFELARAGRDAFEYRESGRAMRLGGGSMFSDLNGHDFGFSFDDCWRSARWLPPHDSDDVSDEERFRIRSNIMEAFAFMNGRVKFL